MISSALFKRPAKWNMLRYSREFDKELFDSLLWEEYEEYTQAILMIDKLDALGDLFFIAVGGLWKLGRDPYMYVKSNHDAIAYSAIKGKAHKDNYSLATDINHIISQISKQSISYGIGELIHSIFSELVKLGLNETDIEDLILAICDSNDTKKQIFVSSDSKGDLKGRNFISPKEEIKEIAVRIRNRHE